MNIHILTSFLDKSLTVATIPNFVEKRRRYQPASADGQAMAGLLNALQLLSGSDFLTKMNFYEEDNSRPLFSIGHHYNIPKGYKKYAGKECPYVCKRKIS